MFILGAPWSRGRALSRRPGGPGSNLAYSSIFIAKINSSVESTYERLKSWMSSEEMIAETKKKMTSFKPGSKGNTGDLIHNCIMNIVVVKIA